jgi:hypothetical protein
LFATRLRASLQLMRTEALRGNPLNGGAEAGRRVVPPSLRDEKPHSGQERPPSSAPSATPGVTPVWGSLLPAMRQTTGGPHVGSTREPPPISDRNTPGNTIHSVTKERAMLIKPRTGQKDFVRHTTRLPREQRDPVRLRQVHWRADGIRPQPAPRHGAGQGPDFHVARRTSRSHVPKPAATPAPRTDTRASARPTAVASPPAAQRA